MSIFDTSPASADIILSNTRGNQAKFRRQAIGVAAGIKPSDHFLGIVSIKVNPLTRLSARRPKIRNRRMKNIDLLLDDRYRLAAEL